jgi:ABC-type polysaccharide/polyol phosphate export permease
MDRLVLLSIYAVLLALVAGVEMLRRSTPVMRPVLQLVTTAMQGIIVVVAMLLLGRADNWWEQLLGLAVVILSVAATVASLRLAEQLVIPFEAPKPVRERRRDRVPELPEGHQ